MISVGSGAHRYTTIQTVCVDGSPLEINKPGKPKKKGDYRYKRGIDPVPHNLTVDLMFGRLFFSET